MDELNNLSMDLTVMIMPWIAILISLVIAIWFKEFATGLAKGLKFKMNKAFNAGDQVILDGQDAVIVSIGTSETVFGIYSEKGYTWRYVPNERIAMLKLEKLIQSDVHIDTEKEKAEKLQALIDTMQNKHIVKNAKDIENLKNDRK
jgi:hypothetical protein|tara:strand:- start:469 stop:906 length:438 start_codon:yes stop_codon:yes gene_type:complete